jgi:hypothetical protein
MKAYASFRDFYPFYLSEHQDHRCRRLHFIGSALALLSLGVALVRFDPWWLLAALVTGYGFAWAGHALYEKNRPATFRYPLYSLLGDWVMFRDMLSGRIPW